MSNAIEIWQNKATAFERRLVTRTDNLAAARRRVAEVTTQLMAADLRRVDLSKRETMGSLIACVCEATELGLSLARASGHAYLIPFGQRFQLIIGYRGMIWLASRAGLTVRASLVFDGETFDVDLGTYAKVTHRPRLDLDPKDAEPVAAYVIFEAPGMVAHSEVFRGPELARWTKEGRAKPGDVWAKHTREMQLKTAIRRAFKRAPLGHVAEAARDAVERAVMRDEQAERDEDWGEEWAMEAEAVEVEAQRVAAEEALAGGKKAAK